MSHIFGNADSNTTVHIRVENNRNSDGILSTCISTLFLCLFSSLHLNILANASNWEVLWKKVVYAFVGLFIPEFIVSAAAAQYYFALKLQGFMSQRLKKLTKPKNQEKADEEEASGGKFERAHAWRYAHSHFAIMGGFAFDTQGCPVNILPNGLRSLTLTSLAILHLAKNEPGIIPDISKDNIEKEKSKSDKATKTWVSIQLGWFAAKIFVRLGKCLPISLLEAFTFLHGMYCVISWFAWLHKPVDVALPHPIKVDTELHRKICAWMVMNSKMGITKKFQMPDSATEVYLVYDKDLQTANQGDPELQDFLEDITPSSEKRWHPETPKLDQTSQCLDLHMDQKIYGFRLIPKQREYKNAKSDDFKYGYTRLNKGDLECLRLASSLRDEREAVADWHFNWRTQTAHKDGMLATKLGMFSTFRDLKGAFPDSSALADAIESPQVDHLIVLILSGGICGIFQTLAWNAPSLSPKVWQASCLLSVAPLPPIALIFLLYLSKSERIVGIVEAFLESRFSVLLWFIFLTAFVVGRILLSVGCVLNFLCLPERVFTKPDGWRYIS